MTDLLVKLGEIPPEGGNPSKVRVLDGTWGPETDEWLDRVRRAWPSVAPNPLEVPAEADRAVGAREIEEEQARPTGPTAGAASAAIMRLAQMRQETSAESDISDAKSSERPKPPNP